VEQGARVVPQIPVKAFFGIRPFRMLYENKTWGGDYFRSKRVMVAPASLLSFAVASECENTGIEIYGFLDRDCVLHGKEVGGFQVFGYSELSMLKPDVILITSQQLCNDILADITANVDFVPEVFVLQGECL
jgi:hypothetical protein